jgi:hypothetical protein
MGGANMSNVSDPCRSAQAALKRAFRRYAEEGARMQQMLFELVSEPENIRVPLIRAEQERLRIAAIKYQQAREYYVQTMLDIEGGIR